MWRIPLSLLGGGAVDIEPLVSTYIGDLWVYLGSPSEPVDVTVRANNVDLAEIIITNDFTAGSTFNFIATNNGRFIGTGGGGGDGGDDNGATGSAGTKGNAGGHAIQSDTFAVNIDVDGGFLLGGGGGGGGGSYNFTGMGGGTPGGGGGGGAGWGDAAGGAAGNPTFNPLAAAGTAGSQIIEGNGGDGGTALNNDGGDGGGYGYGGIYGQFAQPGSQQNVSSGNGGPGGRAGAAFFPVNLATATLNGAKSEATLRTETRLKGEIDGVVNIANITNTATIISAGTETAAFYFVNDTAGTLHKVNTQINDVEYTDRWYSGNSITASDYEVRTVVGTNVGTWDTTPAGWVNGTWQAISISRDWEVTDTSAAGYAGALFQVRRAGDTGGGDEGAMASGFLNCIIEFEP